MYACRLIFSRPPHFIWLGSLTPGTKSHAIVTQHHVRVFVPTNVAVCLSMDPTLVAPAVRAFYERDPIDMKHCMTMTGFPPLTQVVVNTCRYDLQT